MTLALNEHQLGALIQQLKAEADELPIKKAACTIGLQPCGKVWVLGDNLQVYKTGAMCTWDSAQ